MNRQPVIHQSHFWTAEEDAILLRYVKTRPQNLHQCFLAVAEQIGRSEGAVSARWYTKVSKDPANMVYFSASAYHVSINRKNASGITINNSIWRRFVNIVRSIIQ